MRPEIFISAAAPEFNALRKVVKRALVEIGALPLEQPDLMIEHGPLNGVLGEVLGRCSAVIHLLGWQYGPEPAERMPQTPRRSFTHCELEAARQLRLPVYTFVASGECALQDYGPEDAEAQLLHGELRTACLQSEPTPGAFSSPEELGRLIRALRPRLVVRRSLARLPSRPLAEAFVGRVRLLQELPEQLTPGSVQVLQAIPALTALGGTGSSTLAVELAWRLHDERRFDFVFWLPAGLRADFEAALASLARSDSLALLPDGVSGHRARFQAVLEWFRNPEHAGRFLVLVDGVDTEAAWWSLRSFLPEFAGGAVLLTGKSDLMAGFPIHPVAPFSSEQALEFLRSRLGLGPKTPPAEIQALQRLAEMLERLPLALALVAGHLAEEKLAPRQFLAALGERRAGAPVPCDLAKIFECSVAALDEAARGLLRQLACLAPEPAGLPLAVFEQRGDWPIVSRALAALERRNLLGRDESNRTVRVHRTVREMARDRLVSGAHAAEALGAVHVTLEGAMQRTGTGAETAHPNLRELLIPHCRAFLGQLNGHPLEIHTTALARGLAEWLAECGRPAEAEVFARRALAIDERRLGGEHPEVAMRLRELAAVMRTLRRLAEAEALGRRALEIDERTFGEDSAEAALNLHHLAACLREGDRLADAEALCRRSWAIEESHAGPAHPRVAIAMHRVAALLEAQHRLEEAETLYRRALAIEEAALGAKHPRLTVGFYHLGRLLGELGRVEEARSWFERGLGEEEGKFGRDRLELSPVLSEYAAVLASAGLPLAAEKAFRRALKLNESLLGAHHLETALARASLAGLLHSQGQAEAARPLIEAALAVAVEQRGWWRGDHPHLRSLLELRAEVLRSLGCEEAEIARLRAACSPPAPRRERSRWDFED